MIRLLFFTFDEERHLNRRLTQLDVWSLAFGCVIGWSAYVMPSGVFLKNAGPLGTLIAMEIATFVMLIISYNYCYMIRKFPMTGGEFVYAKSAFGNHHGFLCAWFLSLAYLSVIPLNATALNLVMRAVFGNAFQIGFHYHVAGYDVYLSEIFLAIAIMMFLMWLSFGGVQFNGKIQTFLVMVLLAGIFVIIGGMIFSPQVSSSNLKPLFHPIEGNFTKGIAAQIIAVYVTGPMSFVGFDTVPQFMEESKFSPDKVKVVMDTSIICGGFVYVALTIVACIVFPTAYSSWVEYNNDISDLSGITSIATLNASFMVLGKWGLFAIVCSIIAAMLTGIIGFYTATSRLLYSMSRDRMIPSWFSHLNKNGVPTHSCIFCMVIASFTCLIGRAVMGWIFDMASTGAAIGFAYTSLAAFKYALSEKRMDIIIFGLLGFILSLSMAFFLLIPIPSLGVSLRNESYILLILWIILGVVFFFRGGVQKLSTTSKH